MTTEWLDQLDAVHAAASDGPWERGGPDGLYASNDVGELLFDYRDVVLVEDHPVGVRQCAADAALIVAAVNSLPKLTAALRNVLALTDECWPDDGGLHPALRRHSYRAKFHKAIDEALQ